ncbi:MAG TPA: neutral/alkaline non-lysosomal ceramidase N-terminal domain-containing protein [Phycisphaerae bacterium]|nr:neutral/alkaline non-lysosomal ceramidase N-terminal domain-containing protein [Phycisphaerae bacterium]
MRIGFAKSDITPRVGVELCGFGPYCCRHSVAVRDRLWARAMAVEHGGTQVLLVSCDLISVDLPITRRVRRIVSDATGIAPEAIMVHCTHTHSGPATSLHIGWGAVDEPYVETLPQRIARACIEAAGRMEKAALSHAEAPCEGIALNREYDRDAPPLEEVLRDTWRPAKPELTDTTCHVLRADAGGRTIGFVSCFGCHPVVCCAEGRHIHGDFCGVATNLLEREHPGSVGLFLQGALGDVNTCVVHKPEKESLEALDVIAARYANAVRDGLARAQPLDVDAVRHCLRQATFTCKDWPVDKLESMLAEKEARVQAPDATDDSARMDTVHVVALRRLIAKAQGDESLQPTTEVQGFRLGPVAILASGFEIFQAVKNDINAAARSPIPLVAGLTNDSSGYAPDRATTARGGYAADFVPLMIGTLPLANIHDELVAALLDLERGLY